MKKLAIIGGGTRASYIAFACKRLGVESHCFSLSKGAGNALNDVDVFHECDIFDTDIIINSIKEIGITGICATTESTLLPTATIAEKAGLRSNSVSTAMDITNKYINRNKTKGTLLVSPKYCEVNRDTDVESIELSLPVIVKPEALVGGKKGLMVVRDKTSLKNALAFAFDNLNGKSNGKVLIEEFIEGGNEYSVESLSYEGKHYIVQITGKDSDTGEHCVELGHHQPANLSKDMWAKVEKAVEEGLSSIGMQYGPCHTEIKIKDDTIYLIEFNARAGGDHISWPLVVLSTGYPYLEGVVRIALGEFEPIDKAKLLHRYSGIYYVTKQTSYLKQIFDECDKHEWCWEKHYVKDELDELTHNDIENTNFFIYESDRCDPVKELLNK